MKRALFLDRDGVINIDKGYVHRMSDFEFIPGAIDAIRYIQEQGFHPIIVTNQSGIARGLFSEKEYLAFQTQVEDLLKSNYVSVLGTYYCPHHPDALIANYRKKCDCRKPEPGLFFSAALEHSICLNKSIVIGDRVSDMVAAEKAGVPYKYLFEPPRVLRRLIGFNHATVKHSC